VSDPFAGLVNRYEAWFEEHPAAFRRELELLHRFWPARGRRLELGSGTGRFGGALGVEVGLEPSAAMARTGRARLPLTVRGRGEELPFGDGVFDACLAVTVLCFVPEPRAVLEEVRRVLVDGGILLASIVDRASALGRLYLERQAWDPFYSMARILSAGELGEAVESAGFRAARFAQTLLGPPEDPASIPGWEEGHGRGGFVVVKALA
jgi:SAM-dependent methyltransferase